jgi:hypothetical protein
MRRPLFSEGARRKVGKLQTIANGVSIAIQLIRSGVEAIRERRSPKRAEDIFEANPLDVEYIREHHRGVGEPERSDAP